MSDTYQAIYDAVRSRISGCSPNDILSRAAREAFDLGHARAILQQEIIIVSHEIQRPSVLYRPSVAPDGDKWCALYGSNLMEGVAGFGDTPAEAMADFDRAWLKEKTPTAVRLAATGQRPEAPSGFVPNPYESADDRRNRRISEALHRDTTGQRKGDK